MGIEGGVFQDAYGTWICAWAAVVERGGRESLASGIRFPLPEWMAARALGGEELGAIVDAYLDEPEAHEALGAIGLLTNGLLERQAALEQVLIAALAPVLSGSFFVEFPGFQDPKNPFRDKRVREAVSLTIDRRAMNQTESGGMGKPTGNWINDDVQYALDWPEFPRNVEKAKQLLREAGYPNGFDVDWVTPIPAFYSRGERIIAQLREVGIRGRLQTMERGIFFQRLQGGLKEFPGTQIILQGARIAGSWAFWYEGYFKCGGFNSRDRICVKDLDGKFDQYERSINPAERKKLAEEIQRGILENYYLVPVFRHAFVNAIGPKVVAQKWQDVFPTITTGYAYPWEDLKVKE